MIYVSMEFLFKRFVPKNIFFIIDTAYPKLTLFLWVCCNPLNKKGQIFNSTWRYGYFDHIYCMINVNYHTAESFSTFSSACLVFKPSENLQGEPNSSLA